jgi:hypothetical protein
LDDAEVVLLAGHLMKNYHGSDYWERHANVLQGPAAHLGSSRDELDQAAVREAGQQHLLQLGLLEQKPRGRSVNIELTPLGRLLLRRIGLADEDEI